MTANNPVDAWKPECEEDRADRAKENSGQGEFHDSTA
jgi:hypothetical protein